MTTDSVDFASALHAAHTKVRHEFVAARAPMDACHADASATPHAKVAAFWRFREQTAAARRFLRKEARRLKTKDSMGDAP